MRTVTLTNISEPITASGFVVSSDLVNLDPAGSTCAPGVPLPAGGQCSIALFSFPAGPASFQGVMLTVYVGDGVVALTAHMTGTVAALPSRPSRPGRAYRELLPRGGSRTTWEKVPGATSYEVQSSGRVVCGVKAPRLSCLSDKAFGPRGGMWITAANEQVSAVRPGSGCGPPSIR
jgi:hypothetical protein